MLHNCWVKGATIYFTSVSQDGMHKDKDDVYAKQSKFSFARRNSDAFASYTLKEK